MKVIINNDQFQLLATNFHLIEGQGLVQNKNKLITESRMNEYLVKIIINGFFSQIRIGAYNGANALMIVRKLFPSARITGSYIQA